MTNNEYFRNNISDSLLNYTCSFNGLAGFNGKKQQQERKKL